MKHLATTALLLIVPQLFSLSGRNALAGPLEVRLPEIVTRVEHILPESWEVVEVDTSRCPSGWSGESSALYVKLEDTNTRFFHPLGFHYYSYYRLWITPHSWEGEMRPTPYVVDSPPAFLLGIGDDYMVFYQTAGGNVWDSATTSFCATFGLENLCIMDQALRVIDFEMEEKLRAQLLNASVPDLDLNPQRIIGLSGDGPHLYLEYLLGTQDREPETEEITGLTEALAGSVFASFPQIESLYLRRCTTDLFTDTIVKRD